MTIFNSFNMLKESKKYNEKQKSLRESFFKRIRAYIKAENYAVSDAQIGIDALTVERDASQLRVAEAEDYLKELK